MPNFVYLQAVEPAADGGVNVFGANVVDNFGTYGAARVLSGGEFDPGFGDGGFGAVQAPDLIIKTFAVRPDGRLVVAGIDAGDFLGRAGFYQLDAEGRPDLAFGEGGYAAAAVPGVHVIVEGVAVDGERLVGVGAGIMGDGSSGALALRVDPSGALDTSFHAPDGYHLYFAPGFYPLSQITNKVYVRADGSFYSCGDGWRVDGPLVEQDLDVLLARYTPAGEHDAAFGEGGLARLDVQTKVGAFELRSDSCRAVDEAGDGKIVVASVSSHVDFSDLSNIVVARFLPDGTPDPTFGEGGV
ncbi:MAG TPA: hypothetical protein VFS00_30440, partial [Polyangiaceae bacterium]|nr:hypothetical protein [Polyangiaceae bacterium]